MRYRIRLEFLSRPLLIIILTVQQGRGGVKSKDQTDMVFQKLDINQDGVITFEEFIESCLKVINIIIYNDTFFPTVSRWCNFHWWFYSIVHTDLLCTQQDEAITRSLQVFDSRVLWLSLSSADSVEVSLLSYDQSAEEQCDRPRPAADHASSRTSVLFDFD